MTVCIAAPAKTSQGVPAFVLCADTRIEGNHVSEDADKLFRLGKNWVCLGAGVYPHWLAACKRIRRAIEGIKGPVAIDRFAGIANAKLEEYRKSKIFSVTGGEFECIFTGFEGWERKICWANVSASSVRFGLDCSFVSIGSGGSTAHALLSYRGCSESLRFEDIIYMVYEAKRLSEKCPGVGPFTQIMIHGADIMGKGSELNANYLSQGCLDGLENDFERLFVRDIIGVAIPPTCYEGAYPFPRA